MDRENDSVVKSKKHAVICCERRPEISLQYWFIKNSTGNSTMDKETALA
jgi:hypothetical protein